MRSSSFIVWIIIASTAKNVFGCRDTMICYDNEVNKKINTQIGVELTGHYTYLYMSQIMDHHTNSYPKVAKYLRAKAAEELSHAERFIQYQNQRGGTVEMKPVDLYSLGSCETVKTVPQAFKCAMELEAHVTRQLTQLHQDVANIKVENRDNDCSGVSNITEDDLRLTQPMLVTCSLTAGGDEIVTASWSLCHCDSIRSVAYVELEEMIAHEFLDHQVEDTKEIANHYNTLKKLQSADNTPGLGDYLFDKHLEL